MKKEQILDHEKKVSKLRRVNIILDAGYVWGEGWSSQDRENFEREVYPMLQQLGFTINDPKFIATSNTATKEDGSHLYLHPMNFTGNISQEDLDRICEGLAKCSTVNRYGIGENVELEDLSDEEYYNILTDNVKNINNWFNENKNCSPYDFKKRCGIERNDKCYGYHSDSVEILFVGTFLETKKVLEREFKESQNKSLV